MALSKQFPAQAATHNGIEFGFEFPAYSVIHVSAPKHGKNEGDNWKNGMDEFRFEINGQSFEYWTGVGHRKLAAMGESILKRGGLNLHSWGIVTARGYATMLEATIPVLPSLDGFLESILLDGSACDESFEDWAGNFGLDTDSRKALQTYMDCQSNYNKLRKAWPFDRAKVDAYFEAKNA